MSKILALALNTTREAIRNRVLYSILAFAVLMVGVSAIFGSASIGDQIRYIKDFSLMSISLFAVIIAVVLGVNLLHKELSKKTILNTLSKPVARWQFVLGKFFGLLLTVSAITTGMALGLGAFLAVLEGRFDTAILVAAFASLLETMIVVAFAMFFSSLVVTPTLAGMFTIGCFIAGRSTQYLDYFFSGDAGWPLRFVAQALDAMLPRLDYFLIGDRLVHGDSIAVSTLLYLVGYATAYSAVLLLIAAGLFSRREFK
jgi:Cu-processing system permease protein